MTARRNDIQILRGVAVLAVVLYHFGLPFLPAGYLGVDVFFVVSGCLMMQIIGAERDAGSFSLIGFYLRRARRLLPAAFATLLVTAVAAPFFLTQSALESFGAQLVGALTFTANIVLWGQGGYFDVDPAQKPLLHFWSLSLEESFYFVFPLLVLIVAMRHRLTVLAILAAISFALCWVIASGAPSLAFYMLPTRAWELLLGAGVATMMTGRPSLRLPWQAGLAGLGLTLLVMIVPLDPIHPRVDALLVTLGTAAVILCRNDWIRAGVLSRALAHIGDVSYSLYLVHWPLIAFATAAYLGDVPPATMAGLAVAAYLLALIQYRYVETPFRHLPARKAGWPFIRAGVAAGLVLSAAVGAAAFSGGGDPYSYIRRANPGLDPRCDSAGTVYTPIAACQTSESPAVALWGDSFAMQWATALAMLPGASDGLVQITRSACTPIVGLARTDYARDAAECLAYNNDVLTYLAASPTIDTVVMSGRLSRHLDVGGAPLLGPDGLRPPSVEETFRQFLATVRTLLDAGKRVIIIAPAPANGVDIGDCEERTAARLVTVGGQPCGTSIADYLAYDAATIRLLMAVAAETDVTIVWPGAAHCFDGFCSAMSGNALLYREISHLTYEGTAELASLLRLDEIVFGGRHCTAAPEDSWACAIEHPEWLGAAR